MRQKDYSKLLQVACSRIRRHSDYRDNIRVRKFLYPYAKTVVECASAMGVDITLMTFPELKAQILAAYEIITMGDDFSSADMVCVYGPFPSDED